jgi:hypothetical protein
MTNGASAQSASTLATIFQEQRLASHAALTPSTNSTRKL